MDIVAIDILSGLPVTKEGHKYLLVATDDFTKWTEAYPLKDAEASTCMEALYNNSFARMGLARQLHSDRGQTESKLFAELCKLTGVNKSRTTPFHPRSDGKLSGQIVRYCKCLEHPFVITPRTGLHGFQPCWRLTE